MPKTSRFIIIAGAVLILVIAGAVFMGFYVLSNPCEVFEVERASTFLVGQRDRFDHSYQFATSATPDSIVRPVAELQQILMDTLAFPVPACMRVAKNELVQYMGTVVRAFLAYGAQEADTAVRDWLDQSAEHYENFTVELEEVNECAPLCFPRP